MGFLNLRPQLCIIVPEKPFRVKGIDQFSFLKMIDLLHSSGTKFLDNFLDGVNFWKIKNEMCRK